jgi:hypothetical protein
MTDCNLIKNTQLPVPQTEGVSNMSRDIEPIAGSSWRSSHRPNDPNQQTCADESGN